MEKYYRLLNKDTNEVEILLGSDISWAESKEFRKGNVERAHVSGKYYLDKLPISELALDKRDERNKILCKTDIYVLPDYPISAKEREIVFEYRKYLRAIPETLEFPNVDIMSFEEFENKKKS